MHEVSSLEHKKRKMGSAFQQERRRGRVYATEASRDDPPPSDHRVLVCCHGHTSGRCPPRRGTDRPFGDHFMREHIETWSQKLLADGRPIRYYTADIAARSPEMRPDFQGDIFSRQFADMHQGQLFDLVFLPDCGGQWWDYQKTHDTAGFINLVHNIRRTGRIRRWAACGLRRSGPPRGFHRPVEAVQCGSASGGAQCLPGADGHGCVAGGCTSSV